VLRAAQIIAAEMLQYCCNIIAMICVGANCRNFNQFFNILSTMRKSIINSATWIYLDFAAMFSDIAIFTTPLQRC